MVEQDRQAHASLKATPMLQADLVERDPQTFASAAYVGRFGWVDVDLARVDVAELEFAHPPRVAAAPPRSGLLRPCLRPDLPQDAVGIRLALICHEIDRFGMDVN